MELLSPDRQLFILRMATRYTRISIKQAIALLTTVETKQLEKELL